VRRFGSTGTKFVSNRLTEPINNRIKRTGPALRSGPAGSAPALGRYLIEDDRTRTGPAQVIDMLWGQIATR